jgi:hypothetical protein
MLTCANASVNENADVRHLLLLLLLQACGKPPHLLSTRRPHARDFNSASTIGDVSLDLGSSRAFRFDSSFADLALANYLTSPLLTAASQEVEKGLLQVLDEYELKQRTFLPVKQRGSGSGSGSSSSSRHHTEMLPFIGGQPVAAGAPLEAVLKRLPRLSVLGLAVPSAAQLPASVFRQVFEEVQVRIEAASERLYGNETFSVSPVVVHLAGRLRLSYSVLALGDIRKWHQQKVASLLEQQQQQQQQL